MSDNVLTVPLFAWRPLEPSALPGFVALYGHVEYRRVMAKKQERLDLLGRSTCEVDRRHGKSDLVFDHCHEHGWVRGIVCQSCNVKLGQLDAARKLDGIAFVPGNTGFGRIIANCPGGIENIDAWIPSAGPFAQEPSPPRFANPNIIEATFVLGRSNLVHALLGDRTACGLKADKSTRPATIQPDYCTACARTIPASNWQSAVRYRFSLGLIDLGSDDGPEAA